MSEQREPYAGAAAWVPVAKRDGVYITDWYCGSGRILGYHAGSWVIVFDTPKHRDSLNQVIYYYLHKLNAIVKVNGVSVPFDSWGNIVSPEDDNLVVGITIRPTADR